MNTILDALSDQALFAGMFDAPSWRPWKAFLGALFGLPLDEADLALYRRHTGRVEPPYRPSRAATLVCGRRGGKSRILALVATWLATVPDHAPYIVPGETPVVAIIAADRRQATVLLNYVRGLLQAVPALDAMIVDELAETIRLVNGVAIEIHTASIGAPRGRTFLAVLADETAFWPMGDSANPDVEIIDAVRPGLATIPYSLLLIASSPYARKGLLYTNYAKYFGRDDAPTLVWQGSTREMNSSLADDPLIDEMYREDPERAEAEFGAQFRSDIVRFISREAVEAVVARGIIELPPGGGIVYSAFTDPSGGSADSFTLAIAHVGSDGVAVLDAIRETKPPFSPDGVVQEYAALLRSYDIKRVTGDAYAGEWPRERFAAHGIGYDVSRKTKSLLYGEFLPSLNGRRVQLLDIPRLVGQLCTLERRTARGGRDSIDHKTGAHDDVANVAAGCLVNALADRAPALVRPTDLLTESGEALPPVLTCDAIVAVLAVDPESGMSATVYGAHIRRPLCSVLSIVDFDVAPLTVGIWPGIVGRLSHLHRECGCRTSAILFVPLALAEIATSARIRAEVIPEDFRDEAALLLPAAVYLTAGRVKITADVERKALSSPFGATISAFRATDTTPSPLRTAALQLVLLSLNGTEPSPIGHRSIPSAYAAV